MRRSREIENIRFCSGVCYQQKNVMSLKQGFKKFDLEWFGLCGLDAHNNKSISCS